MSRAKKTKRAKEYSRIHLYRHFEELSNHAKNVLSQRKPQTRATTDVQENVPTKTNQV